MTVNSTRLKILLITLKILLAAALMAWVLRGVALHRHVIDAASGEKIPARSLVVKSGGDFQLIRPDGSQEDYPAGQFARVNPEGAAVADNFLRHGLVDVFDRADFMIMTLAFVLLALSYCAGAWRWQKLIAAARLKLPFWSAIRLTWLGLFFNNVILGTTGGDIAKVFALSRRGHSRTESLMTVMADRIFGLFSLVLLAGVSAALMLILKGRESIFDGFYLRLKLAAAIIAIAFAGIGFCVWFVMRLSGQKPLPPRLDKIMKRFNMDKRFSLASGIFKLYGKDFRIIFGAISRSMLMQGIYILSIWQFSAALGLSIDLLYFVLFIPLIYMIAAVPVTPGAVGVVEGLYVGLFGQMAGPSELLILALCVRLAILVCSMPGVLAILNWVKPQD